MAKKVFNPITPPFDQVSDSISDITGLQTALDGKVAKAGDTMTGNLNMGTNNLIGGTGVTSVLKLQGTTANGTANAQAINLLVGNNGATTALTVLNNGRIGIGTVAPSAFLNINSGTVSNAAVIEGNDYSGNGIFLTVRNNNTGNSSYSGYRMAPGGTFFGARAALNGWGIANGISFRADNGRDVSFTAEPIVTGSLAGPSMILKSGGNLGIGLGSVSPTAQLQVHSRAASTVTQIIRGAASQTADLTQWQDSTGTTVLAEVMSNGTMKYVFGGPTGSALQTVATDTYVQARGQNLLTNGFGYLRDNTNFTQFNFDTANQATGIGGFSYDGPDASRLIYESFAVDNNEIYNFSYYIKLLNKSVPSETPRFYSGIQAYDADNQPISAIHVYKWPGSTYTSLAADLNNGDTTITLTNATGWQNGGDNTQRRIGFYPYTNSQGFTYPDYTYTRDVTGGNAWSAGGISGNVITLSAPWSGGFKPAGTKVANNISSSTYEYMTVNVNTPTEHTKYNDYIGKVNGDWASNAFTEGQTAQTGHQSTSPDSKLRWGVSRINLLYLLSYNTPVGTAKTIVSGLSFGLSENTSLNYRIGNLSNTTADAVLNVTNTATDKIGQVIKGISGQTADLLQVQNSSGSVLADIDSTGVVQAAGYKSSDGSAGVGGTFTTTDGKTITIKDGLVTSIV